MAMFSEQPLPGMPVPPVSPVRRPPPGTRVVRVRPTRLCERCCQLIHQRGQAGAPYPNAARWRVELEAGGEWRLCDTHKDERCGR